MNEEKKDRNPFQWQPLVELVVVLATIIGFTIPLYIHTDNKLEIALAKFDQRMEEGRKESNNILEAIRQDMRDFHGRLCAIEERNKERK